MHHSGVILQNPRAPKPLRPGGEPGFSEGASAAASERELQRIEGMKIAQSADRGLGISTKENRGSWVNNPNCALAASPLFTRATNQRIMMGTEPSHVLSTSHLYNSILNDSRFMQMPMSHATPGDIVIQSGLSPDGYAGIVVDHGRIVSGSSKGVQNNSSLMEIQHCVPPVFLFRYIGVQKYSGYTMAFLANAGFNPDEPRIPAGQPGGGQWTGGMAPPTAVLSGVSTTLLPDQFRAQKTGQKAVQAPAKTSDSPKDASKADTSDSLLAKVLQALEEAGDHPTPSQMEKVGQACDAWQHYAVDHGVPPDVAGALITDFIRNYYHPGGGLNPGTEAVIGFQQGQQAGADAAVIIAAAVIAISKIRSNRDAIAPKIQGDVKLRALTPEEEKTYARVEPRQSTRDAIREKYTDEDGKFRDAVTKDEIEPGSPWVMGHKPGFEFRKMQVDAASRGISREQFVEEQNNPNLYQPELPSTSSRRAHEAPEHLQLPPGAAGTGHEDKY